MGHSQSEKKSNHERIVRTAAKRLREKGLEAVAIADVMKEVGLTVGGFYKHFDSRDDLVVEALRAASWQRTVQPADAGEPSVSLAGFSDGRGPICSRTDRRAATEQKQRIGEKTSGLNL